MVELFFIFYVFNNDETVLLGGASLTEYATKIEKLASVFILPIYPNSVSALSQKEP